LQFVGFDASYLERLKSGDGHTERHFVTYFSELIRLKLRSRVNSREAIEDLTQETFVRVLAVVRSEAGVKQPERLGAMVNSVCNNVLLEHYRSKRRQESALEPGQEDALIDPEPSAYSRLAADDTQRTVRATLSELAERDRQLLQSVLLEARDKGEICAEFGVTRDYLRLLVHRAKQTFKSLYIKHLDDTI
jgi:RNA polymerase sigma-70 factor, ECF subfamily